MDDLDRVIGIQKRRVSSLYAVAKKSQDKKAEQKYLDALLILKVLKGEKGCCEIPAPNVPDATQRQKPKKHRGYHPPEQSSDGAVDQPEMLPSCQGMQ